jgi:hypothetical protein
MEKEESVKIERLRSVVEEVRKHARREGPGTGYDALGSCRAKANEACIACGA